MVKRKKQTDKLQYLIRNYGSLLFQWAFYTIEDPSQRNFCLREVFRILLKNDKKLKKPLSNIERAWFLRLSLPIIQKFSNESSIQDKSLRSELTQASLDERLDHFHAIFAELSFEDKSLLLLWDLLQVSPEEISTIFHSPQDSLKLKRHQTLRKLEDLIWQEIESNEDKIEILALKIKSFKKPPLPKEIRTSPLKTTPAELDGNLKLKSRPKWNRLPWFLRSALEGLGIAGIVFAVILTAPQVRSFYEQSKKGQIDIYDLFSIEMKLNGSSSRTHSEEVLASSESTAYRHPSESDENSDDLPEEEILHDDILEIEDIFVGNSELWRFHIKTDNLRVMKERVQAAFKEIEISEDLPGTEGVRVPGGVQFNFHLQKEHVPALKHHLELIGKATVFEQRENLPVFQQEAFTWYRSRARRHVPAGKAHVVIWLYQL
jgi:hypothetical protein